MNTKMLFGCLLFLLPLGMMAQSSGKYVPISISYFGNIGVHPGIKLEGELVWAHAERIKVKKKGSINFRKELFSGVSVAGYVHPATHTGIIPGLNIGGRLLPRNSAFVEGNIGLNYYAIVNQGESWELDESGNPVNLGTTSRGYFAPSISLGAGQIFPVKAHLAMGFFARVNNHFLLGYNSTMVPQPGIEVGLRILPNFTSPSTNR